MLSTTQMGSIGLSNITSLYNNQFFDYLSEQLPKDIKELFRWCEMVFINSPVVINAIRKLAYYPITDFTYKTESETVREETKKFLEETLNIKDILIQAGVDYHVYGNVFRSVYMPFDRFLQCKACDTEISIKQAEFKIRRSKFILKCPDCGDTRAAEIKDRKSTDLTKVKLVTWDPKQIEVNKNFLTGESMYYYTLPNKIRQSILQGDKNTVSSLPKVFFQANQSNKALEMGSNFYHMRAHELAGFASGWALPPLTAILKLYLYISILRKAVEAISMEHIIPQRILFPQATTTDPTVISSMNKWQKEVTNAFKQWRQDPNYVMLAPYPTGKVNVGSEGRQLMPTEEIKQAEEEMIRALDIPVEFVYGTTNLQNSGITLRILENQLTPYVSQLENFINWIVDRVNAEFGKKFCHVEFTSFALSDDMFQKQMLLNLAGTMVSRSTILETLGLDPDEEIAKMISDSTKELEMQKQIEVEQAQAADDIGLQTAQEVAAAGTGTIPEYDQQKLYAQAEELAAQLINIPYEERRSYLASIQNEDFVMYAMVTAILDSMHAKQPSQPTTQPTAPTLVPIPKPDTPDTGGLGGIS